MASTPAICWDTCWDTYQDQQVYSVGDMLACRWSSCNYMIYKTLEICCVRVKDWQSPANISGSSEFLPLWSACPWMSMFPLMNTTYYVNLEKSKGRKLTLGVGNPHSLGMYNIVCIWSANWISVEILKKKQALSCVRSQWVAVLSV